MFKFLKSKTILFMIAAASVPLIDLLGGFDVQAFLEPKVCTESVGEADCGGLMENITEIYAAFIALVGIGLRLVTKQPVSAK